MAQDEMLRRKLKFLEDKEYLKKIVILFNPNLNEESCPHQNKKEFYIEGSNEDVENLYKILEVICAKKYSLYNGVIGNRFVMMSMFHILLEGVDTEDKNDLPVLNTSSLSRNFYSAIEETRNFLETVPIQPYLPK